MALRYDMKYFLSNCPLTSVRSGSGPPISRSGPVGFLFQIVDTFTTVYETNSYVGFIICANFLAHFCGLTAYPCQVYSTESVFCAERRELGVGVLAHLNMPGFVSLGT